MNMKHSCTHLPEEARSVHLLKIDGFSVTRAIIGNNKDHIKSRCSVFGYDWEIRLYPASLSSRTEYLVGLELVFLGDRVGLELVFLGEARTRSVTATLLGRLVEYATCGIQPTEYESKSKSFRSPSDRGILVYIASGRTRDDKAQGSGTLTVECTISVLREPEEANICLPDSSGNKHRHLGELLRSEAGADVTFAVSGESLAAHKNILAARSPVFKAEFFGEMQEKTTQRVEIKDMDAQVFRAIMLSFIYTDMVPDEFEFENQSGAVEEQAACVEFIAGSPENLDAVVATEGYRHLEASSPWVLTELLKAALSKK
ncbi:unnamed protein product [Urochloa decumbens]|uniref:BTB domain-containing protein n=1 Tax=Urochloa decumbens TaxID=240449 RepID=A0ABC8VLL7_9POAL